MNNVMKGCLAAAFALMGTSASFGQASDYNSESGYNPNSLRPIHKSQVMYRMGIWRRVDLRHRPNAPFFASGNEISKLIIEAVKEGRLTPYKNDSLTTTMTKDEFMANLTIEDGAGSADDMGGLDDFGGFGDFGTPEGETAAPTTNTFLPRELCLLEICEDLIFDRQRSRMFYDILAVSMILPGDNPNNFSGLEKNLGTFRYVDLVRVFEENPNAVWYNSQNRAEDKPLAHAFDLRLFHGYIVRMSNPRNQALQDIYNANLSSPLLAAQQKEYDIIEWENDLWDY